MPRSIATCVQRFVLLVSILICVTVGVLVPAAAPADEAMVDGIAAQVGSRIVLVSEVMRSIASREEMMRKNGASNVDVAKLRADGLEQLIEARLIERVVQQTELYASDAEVDNAVASIAEENGISVAQLESSVQAQGLAVEDYRQRIKEELERRKVVNAMVASQVRVEDDEVAKLYQERFDEQPDGGNSYHLRQILVPYGASTGLSLEEACAEVQQAEARIAAGESFPAVAQQVSRVEPQRGGDIGWLHEESLAAWMTQEVGALQQGQVSELIELPFGCCLLELVEIREFEAVTLEQATPMLEQEIHAMKVNDEFVDWMETLRENTYIERHGYFAEAAELRSRLSQDDAEEDEEEGGFALP